MFAVTHQYKWSDLDSLGMRETLLRQLPGTNAEGRDEVKEGDRDSEKDKVERLSNTQENQHTSKRVVCAWCLYLDEGLIIFLL